MDIQDKVNRLYGDQGEGLKARKVDCGNTLIEDHSLVEMIYTEYMKCPLKGWDPDKACSGEYASNPNYTTENGKCVIGGCWNGGWDQPRDYDSEGYDNLEEYCIEKGCVSPAKDTIWAPYQPFSNRIDKYMNASTFAMRDSLDILVGVMCKFVIPEAGSAENAKKYLEDFPLDSTLLEKHYFLVGRSEGRPYKYCNNGETQERTAELALKLKSSKNFYFYDYSKYLFCFNKNNYKVYVTQEGK
ncbi:hypothetical protein R83H12_02620 [Fibrobacteria bacterium R8-3-H12]